MKNVAVLTEDGAFALFFRSHPGGFDSSRVLTPGNLPSKVKIKIATARGQPQGGGEGSKTLHKQQSDILYILQITDPFIGLIKTTTHQRRTKKCVCI